MIDAAMLERDREELAQGLERLRRQQAELARVVAMQEGALWYVERLIGGGDPTPALPEEDPTPALPRGGGSEGGGS
jgi:hypothetical protein